MQKKDKKAKGQKDNRTKGQRVKRTKGQKDKRTKGQKDKNWCGKDMTPFLMVRRILPMTHMTHKGSEPATHNSQSAAKYMWM